MTEDEMVGWHHWLSGSEFEQATGVCDGQGSSTCCSPWVCRESEMTVSELNWTAGLHKLLGDFGVEFILLIGVYTRLQDESMGKDLKCNFNHWCDFNLFIYFEIKTLKYRVKSFVTKGYCI